MRKIEATVRAVVVGGVVLGGMAGTPVLAVENGGGLTFRQALGAKPSSIFQFTKPSIVVANETRAPRDEATEQPAAPVNGKATVKTDPEAVQAGAAVQKAGGAGSGGATSGRGSVRLTPRGTMEPGELRELPVPRRKPGVEAVETLPGPNGEMPKVAVMAQPLKDTKTAAKAPAVVAAKPKEAMASAEKGRESGGQEQRHPAAADAAGAPASPDAQVAEGGGGMSGPGDVGSSDAVAAFEPVEGQSEESGGGAAPVVPPSADAEGERPDAHGHATARADAMPDVQTGAGKGTSVDAEADGRGRGGADVAADGTGMAGEPIGEDSGMALVVAFLGGVAACGALVLAVTGIVQWRRRRAKGDSVGRPTASERRPTAKAACAVEKPASQASAAVRVAGMVERDRADRGRIPVEGADGVRGGHAPVPEGAGLASASATADEGGRAVVAMTGGRSAAKAEVTAPWLDAGHRAAVVGAAMMAVAPRSTARAA